MWIHAGIIARSDGSGAALLQCGELGFFTCEAFQKLHLVGQDLAVLHDEVLGQVGRVGHGEELHVGLFGRAGILGLVAVAA